VTDVGATRLIPGFLQAEGCDLCKAARVTPWYYEDDICWIAECEICAVPMVVWRYHGATPPDTHLSRMRDRLSEIAAAPFGDFYVDDRMRNIPDHYHAHGRQTGGFFGHGVPRLSAAGNRRGSG